MPSLCESILRHGWIIWGNVLSSIHSFFHCLLRRGSVIDTSRRFLGGFGVCINCLFLKTYIVRSQPPWGQEAQTIPKGMSPHGVVYMKNNWDLHLALLINLTCKQIILQVPQGAKPNQLPVFENKVYWNPCSFIYILSMVSTILKQQKYVVMTGTVLKSCKAKNTYSLAL